MSTTIVTKLTVRKKPSSFDFVVSSILFGVFSYLTVQIFIDLFYGFSYLLAKEKEQFKLPVLSVWGTIRNDDIIAYVEVFSASVSSIFLGLFACYLDTHKVLNRFATAIKVSYKYGDENLYSYFLNAQETSLVYVRLKDSSLIYKGYIDSYSETDDISELVLSNVTVYRYEDSEEIYEIARIYLSLNKSNILIECPK